MITRRNFIKTTTFAAASAMLAPGLVKASSMKKHIGLQLYTVRDLIDKDLPGTLKKIADIGYTWLEAAGYNEGKFYNLSPKDFKSMVDDLGMVMVSSHVGFEPGQSRQIIDAHLELGVSHVILPSMSLPEMPSRDDYARKAELFNTFGEACKQAGLKFGYHNHDFEFIKIDGTTGFDILLEMTDPELVCFETDIYWMKYANVNPVDYFQKYPGRFDLWHVKDMADNPERSFAEVGEGTIDYDEIFRKASKISGMEYFFVEQDSCNGDPLDSIAISYNNIREIL